MDIRQLTCSAQRKFTVSIVKTENILDFKGWWTKFYKRDVISVNTKSRQILRNQKLHFLISHFMEFGYTTHQIGCVICHSFIQNMERVNTFELRNNRSVIPALPEKKAYNGPIPINIKKIEDLRRTLQYIPHTYKDYFVNNVENMSNKIANNDIE
ncbi:unnamed protein product [Parnassius apollo]|uniref:(apollo) hypothetical protein n=1 Tax=Parnassius apollo TaxID=110799 RepID=A0A8S3WXH8_PARAO|nr:unnamed protein product [Parnassius apollo]